MNPLLLISLAVTAILLAVLQVQLNLLMHRRWLTKKLIVLSKQLHVLA